MDIGKLISAFGTGYLRLPDNRPDFDTKKKRTHLNKKTFCRELLCAISADEDIILYENGLKTGPKRFPSAFEAYYRNKQRRSLRPIAKPLLDGNFLDEEKFHRFLEQYIVVFSKEKLYANFQDHITTTPETLFDDITSEFVRILEAEANKPDGRQKEPIPSHTKDETDAENAEEHQQEENDTSSSPSAETTDRSNIKQTIIQITTLIKILLASGKKIAIWVNRHYTSRYDSCPEWQSFQENYRLYVKCFYILHTYVEIYKNELLSELAHYEKPFSSELFWQCNYIRSSLKVASTDELEKYKEALSVVLRKL